MKNHFKSYTMKSNKGIERILAYSVDHAWELANKYRTGVVNVFLTEVSK